MIFLDSFKNMARALRCLSFQIILMSILKRSLKVIYVNGLGNLRYLILQKILLLVQEFS